MGGGGNHPHISKIDTCNICAEAAKATFLVTFAFMIFYIYFLEMHTACVWTLPTLSDAAKKSVVVIADYRKKLKHF